jgi:hypothetical protein
MGNGLQWGTAFPPSTKPQLINTAEENAEFILVDAV